MRTKAQTTTNAYLKNKWRPFFSMLPLILLFTSTVSMAQITPANCVQGCTSNDVRIQNAYLSDAAGNKLSSSFVCPISGTANVFLTLELTTSTPRVGVAIYTKIKRFDPVTQTVGTEVTGSPISQCFGIALNQPTNKVTFQQSFSWTCGTPIVMTDVFIAWGTGNSNFCTGTPFQCPATPSKCYQLPGGSFIAIETPVPQNQTVTQCSDAKGGTTSTFNLNNINVTSSINVTVTWWQNFTSPSTFTNQIATPSAYVSPTRTIYAKITSNSNSSVFSVSTVNLVVNQTPNLVVTNPAAVCSPATADITAVSVTSGSTLPAGTVLSYYLNNNGSPGTSISSSTAQALGAGTYWIKATTNTTPACSDQKQVVVTVNQTPAAPILSKVDNCNGTTTITAKDGSNNNISSSELTWSNAATGNPITVSNTTPVTATRTVSGCSSSASTPITPAPRTTPAAPVLSKVDNCDGTTTITAKDASNNVISASELTWSNGAVTNPMTVSTTTAVTATRTINGCTSGSSNSITPAPKTTPAAPILSKVDNCDGTTTITAKDAGNNVISASELTWSNGAVTNPITVNTTITVSCTRTINGCTSGSSNIITPAPKTTPAAPILSKVDNCNGTSTITAKDAGNNTISSSELTWSNGATGNPITVNTTAAVTATRTVNGCTSGNSNSITPAPRNTPAAPVLSKVDNCDGTTIITARDAGNNVISASELTWSNGAVTNPITVSTTTAVTATRTVNGCTSGNSNIITPAPGSAPGNPSVTYNPPACDQTTFSVTITGISSGVTYTIKDKNGANIAGVAPGNSVTAANTGNITFSNIPAGSGYQVTASLGSCSSTASSCGAAQGTTTRVVNNTNVALQDDGQVAVKAYPNPFNDRVKFVVNSPDAGNGSLEIYNMLGQRVKTVYEGHINAGNQSFELAVPKKQQATLVYIFRVGSKQITGKLIQLNN